MRDPIAIEEGTAAVTTEHDRVRKGETPFHHDLGRYWAAKNQRTTSAGP